MLNKKTGSGLALVSSVVGVLLLAAGPARAEGPNLLDQGFDVSLGSFIVNQNTEVQLNGRGEGGDFVEGTPIDWEKTFGEGDVTRFRLDGYWRFAERHKARMMYFSSSRTNSRTI